MITKEDILNIAEEYANSHGLFVVEVLVKKENRITVYIDSLNGLELDHCIKLTKQIESKFDREVEDYSLEVSSPGLDYPLHMPQQFQKNINRELIIFLKKGAPISGVLKSFNEDSLGIEIEKIRKEGKKKQKEMIIENIPLSTIKQAKVKVVFK
jgi:ribosome maturation factor RimP